MYHLSAWYIYGRIRKGLDPAVGIIINVSNGSALLCLCYQSLSVLYFKGIPMRLSYFQ